MLTRPATPASRAGGARGALVSLAALALMAAVVAGASGPAVASRDSSWWAPAVWQSHDEAFNPRHVLKRPVASLRFVTRPHQSIQFRRLVWSGWGTPRVVITGQQRRVGGSATGWRPARIVLGRGVVCFGTLEYHVYRFEGTAYPSSTPPCES